MTTNYLEREAYEDPLFWRPERYLGLETERAALAVEWIPSDVESIVDIGCGNGVFTNRLSDISLVVGADRSWSALRHVQVHRCQADITHIPFRDSSFDMTIAMEVIEHLPFSVFAEALREVARVARRYVLITVPYKENLALSRVVCPKCGCEFHRHWHMRSFSKSILETLFHQHHPPLSLIRIEHVVPKRVLFPADELRSLLHIKSTFSRFALCPQCGYRGAAAEVGLDDTLMTDIGHACLGYLKPVIRKCWPLRKTKYFWWMALYVKG